MAIIPAHHDYLMWTLYTSKNFDPAARTPREEACPVIAWSINEDDYSVKPIGTSSNYPDINKNYPVMEIVRTENHELAEWYFEPATGLSFDDLDDAIQSYKDRVDAGHKKTF